MAADETIRKCDQARLRQWRLTLGYSFQWRELRVALQYSQALDVRDLLTRCAARQTELASAALFRFGLDRHFPECDCRPAITLGRRYLDPVSVSPARG